MTLALFIQTPLGRLSEQSVTAIYNPTWSAVQTSL